MTKLMSAKTRPGADCGPDYELLVAKYRLKLKKGGKTTRPFRYESESQSHSVVSDSLWPHGLNSPGQNTGVGSLSLLQGIFLIQGSNPGLPYCRWILYQLSHKGSPLNSAYMTFPTGILSWLARTKLDVSLYISIVHCTFPHHTILVLLYGMCQFACHLPLAM